eukprot:TRINITY_DN22614_c0_g1_i1.p1 TRINITY_DN22614_c0_g1~~TRINITY_DN22614_c0_g1_i1.p1  ORF type:complete len:271 (+),score=37.27 TRINITY_DN22614_c0_g1_i1:36-815(+)
MAHRMKPWARRLCGLVLATIYLVEMAVLATRREDVRPGVVRARSARRAAGQLDNVTALGDGESEVSASETEVEYVCREEGAAKVDAYGSLTVTTSTVTLTSTRAVEYIDCSGYAPWTLVGLNIGALFCVVCACLLPPRGGLCREDDGELSDRDEVLMRTSSEIGYEAPPTSPWKKLVYDAPEDPHDEEQPPHSATQAMPTHMVGLPRRKPGARAAADGGSPSPSPRTTRAVPYEWREQGSPERADGDQSAADMGFQAAD